MRRAEDSDPSTADSTSEEEEHSRTISPAVPQSVLASAETSQSKELTHRIPGEGERITNNPNDEVFTIVDDRDIRTPPQTGNKSLSESQLKEVSIPGRRLISNNPNDERVDILDADVMPTPRSTKPPTSQSDSEAGHTSQRVAPFLAQSGGTTPVASSGARVGQMSPEDDDDASEESNTPSRYRPSNYLSQKPEAIEVPVSDGTPSAQPVLRTNLEYNPVKYAKVNANATREMQELFKHILDYQPFVAELPAKLRPFIPDYIPAVGELDPFVKVPRPDGHPDGLGLYMIDEPTIPQSNPAVVQLELRATNVHMGASAQVVDSFEDAANRPEVIDRWIADVKKVHYKKPLPTVNYQRPMPEIDTLLQAWPQAFEDILNSDLQFPPPHIDLDLEQYVRTLCAILDIPTYNSLIDSLHVMFTLYEEFRANQHFQHE